MGDISSKLMDSLNQVTATDNATSQMLREQMNPNEFGGVEGVDDEEYMQPPIHVPEIEVKEKDSNLTTTIPESNIVEDANRVRDVTYAMQEVSIELLKGSVKMACETENPRAYTVCNELMTTIRGLNKDLLDSARMIEEVKAKAKPASVPEGGSVVEVDEDGKVKVTTTPKGHSTKNLLALVEEMRKNGGDASAIDNESIKASSRDGGDIEEAEVVEDV